MTHKSQCSRRSLGLEFRLNQDNSPRGVRTQTPLVHNDVPRSRRSIRLSNYGKTFSPGRLSDYGRPRVYIPLRVCGLAPRKTTRTFPAQRPNQRPPTIPDETTEAHNIRRVTLSRNKESFSNVSIFCPRPQTIPPLQCCFT